MLTLSVTRARGVPHAKIYKRRTVSQPRPTVEPTSPLLPLRLHLEQRGPNAIMLPARWWDFRSPEDDLWLQRLHPMPLVPPPLRISLPLLRPVRSDPHTLWLGVTGGECVVRIRKVCVRPSNASTNMKIQPHVGGVGPSARPTGRIRKPPCVFMKPSEVESTAAHDMTS